MRAVVLMYHRLGTPLSRGGDEAAELYTIDAEAFEQHLEILTRSPVPVLPYDRLTEDWPRVRPLSGRAVAITFDDGFASDCDCALPSLSKRNLRAAFFVSPLLVGSPGYVGWADVRLLLAAGMTVGAHGLDHTPLGSLGDDELRAHLRDARRVMEAQLGRAPEHLSLPHGSGGARAVRVALEVGFRVVAGSRPGLCRPGRAGELPRYAVRRSNTPAYVRALAEQRSTTLALAGLRHWGLVRARRLLGERIYQVLRHAVASRLSS